MGSAHRQIAQKKLKLWETLGRTKSKGTPRREKPKAGRCWGGRWPLSPACGNVAGPLRDGFSRFGHGTFLFWLSVIACSGVAVAVGAAMGDRPVQLSHRAAMVTSASTVI